MAIKLSIPSNKLHPSDQTLESSENLLVMIGENGCGKSAILEKVFQAYLVNPDKQVVCFTSGMNESYSPSFNAFVRKNRKFLIQSDNVDIDEAFNSFYFHGAWAKALIFFATALKRTGRVREYLREKGYCEISNDGLNDDTSTVLRFSLRIDTYYVRTIQAALKREEEEPDFRSIRRTVFHRLLSYLSEKFIHSEYDFEQSQRKRGLQIRANEVFDIFGSAKEKELFTFLSLATKDSRFINIWGSELLLKGLKINDLSDGEFQILTVCAMLDLFDTPDTLFLFDEIDSHLHYQNIQKLWRTLNEEVKGIILTTTHSADSIVCNSPEVIKLVKEGRVETMATPDEIFDRLSILSSSNTYSLQLMAKLPFIALVDDRSDWFIFKELCKIKIGESDSKILDNVSVIKCFSGHSTKDERFGIAKIQKVKGLYEICRDAKKNCTIFMICDKDNYPITNISQHQGNLEVKGADLQYMEKELGQRNQHKATLLSWKRREIENYLLSETMLTKYGRLDEVKELIAAKYHVNLSNGNNEGLTEPDVKSIVKSLYLKDAHSESDDNEKGTDYEKLKKVISEIPATEISADIAAMFNFIKGKIQAAR